MKEYLAQLRARSESSRRRIAFFASLALTLLIGGVWLTNLRFSEQAALITQKTQDSPGVIERIRVGWEALTASVQKFK